LNVTRQKWFWILILAVAGTCVGLYLNHTDFFPNQVRQFQKTFLKKELILNNYLAETQKYVDQLDRKKDVISSIDRDYYLHYYRNDSLIYWNSNHLPIGRFADIHYPSDGLIHLQNGWYYAQTFREENKTLCAAFLIKSDYTYENPNLRNEFNEDFNLDKHTQISLDQDEGYAVKNQQGQYVFSLVPPVNREESSTLSQIMLFYYLIIFALWICLILLVFRAVKSNFKWILPLSLLLLKYFALHFSLFHFRIGEGALDPAIYGTSKLLPNFFEYLTNILVILGIFWMIEAEIYRLRISKILAMFLLLGSVLCWIPIRELTEGLVENSSIPLSIDRLFSLNGYTILAILSIGGLLYMQYLVIIASIRYWKRCELNHKWGYLLVFIVLGCIFLWVGFLRNETIVPEVTFALFTASVLYDNTQRQIRVEKNLPFALLILTLGTLCVTCLTFFFNLRREIKIQEFYSQQLTTEKSIATELEYPKIIDKITSDPVLTRLNSMNEPVMSSSEFEDGLERRIFNGFWERYELNFFLFDSLGELLISEGEDVDENRQKYLNELIEKHGKVSSINKNIYFIGDHFEQYSYIIKQELYSTNKEKRLFIVTLRSKKIPEDIGFPRLLVSGNSQALHYLENYSLAKYHNGKLIVCYGPFNFPYLLNGVYKWTKKGNFRIKDNYRHVILQTDSNDISVLSSKQADSFSFISSFSYLFVFFGSLLIPVFFRFRQFPLMKSSLPLSTRIHVILLGIVFVSLIAFSWSSSSFIRKQYEVFSANMITDKMRSMAIEISGKLNYQDKLTLEKHGNTMQATLEKIARIYRTDVNLYETQGFMIASSRPKIYRSGLLGDQMNRKALHTLGVDKKSRFIHEEHIGNLTFASAYLPCFNKQGKLLGFLNLQFFNQQREIEEQIATFVVSIINIFMLLLALSLVTALILSNWLTAPLRILKEKLSHLKLGAMNEPIHYTKEDEIGALVSAYNLKLEELDFTAAQLAKSERESAWKEMAKQVAHEIKNPLTPMKLSVQQFVRSFDPSDPRSSEKLKRVSSSLIEQIDALTRIANEFSSFAQMPPPREINLDLVELLKNVIHVFQETTSKAIELNGPNKALIVKADKDQLIRVFNNLIKNAIQAKSSERKFLLKVNIEESKNDGVIIIIISDNGVGIPLKEQNKIFTPHFTTKSGGSGLGLTMVKQIVENHNGSISFESTPLTGTTFKIILPTKQP
jgi:two-component system nitrogen regulation sensor histidine kinase NtrY